ncbi:MAG TPA: DUF2065 domain-containing protein [Pseudomonadales bacterium]|nr:DUF2065 domain-containing protein [Pseudomonadales bacterium]
MQELWTALALVLVFEGLMPSIAPATWRQTILSLLSLSDRQLRIGGLICMVLGAFILSMARS